MAPATLAEKASTTMEVAAAFAAPPLGAAAAASPAGLETGTDMGVVGSAAPSFDGVFFLEELRSPMVSDATGQSHARALCAAAAFDANSTPLAKRS